MGVFLPGCRSASTYVQIDMKLVIIICLLLLPSVWAQTHIRVIDYSFIPLEVTVHAGQTVVWTNEAVKTRHRIKFTTLGEISPLLEPGQSFSKTFDEEGFFPFQSAAFPAKMRGTIKVVEAAKYSPKTYVPGSESCVNCTIVCQGENCTAMQLPNCGDGICQTQENAASCCTDCPCAAGFSCRALSCTPIPVEKKPKKTLFVIGGVVVILAVGLMRLRKIRRGY